MFTMRPNLRARMPGSTAWVSSRLACRCSAETSCKVFSSTLSTVAGSPPPALLMRPVTSKRRAASAPAAEVGRGVGEIAGDVVQAAGRSWRVRGAAA